jgi:hypothetical protein
MRAPVKNNFDDPPVPEFLRQLKPTSPPANIAREIWFQAGYQSGRRQMNAWRAATGCAVAAIAFISVWHPSPPTSQTSNPVVAVTHEPPPGPIDAAALNAEASDYARLCDGLLRDGLQSWPGSKLPSGNAAPPLEHRSNLTGDDSEIINNLTNPRG